MVGGGWIILVMIVTILGPSGVIAAIGYSTIQALGRNPSAAPKILQAMIISIMFAVAIAIISFLVLLQLFGKA